MQEVYLSLCQATIILPFILDGPVHTLRRRSFLFNMKHNRCPNCLYEAIVTNIVEYHTENPEASERDPPLKSSHKNSHKVYYNLWCFLVEGFVYPNNIPRLLKEPYLQSQLTRIPTTKRSKLTAVQKKTITPQERTAAVSIQASRGPKSSNVIHALECFIITTKSLQPWRWWASCFAVAATLSSLTTRKFPLFPLITSIRIPNMGFKNIITSLQWKGFLLRTTKISLVLLRLKLKLGLWTSPLRFKLFESGNWN